MSYCSVFFNTDFYSLKFHLRGIIIFPKDKIHLGLDLQGGMHLLLEIDTDKALEAMMERTSNDLKESLMDKQSPFP